MVLAATAHSAHAANKPSAVVVQISGRLDATVDAVTDPRCVAQGYTLSGTPEKGAGAIYKGTLVGVGGFCNQAKLPLLDASGGYYHEQHTFVGTVRGCSTGTFKYAVDGVLHPFDVGKGYFPADEDWIIVKGSGTGGLVGIGSGLNHRTGGITKEGTAFAVFDPAINSLTCIPTHRNVGIAVVPATTLPMTGIGVAGASLGLATVCGGLLLLRLRRRVLSASG